MSRRKEETAEVKSAFVEVTATRTINVTCGLQHEDLSNPDPYVKDGFKVREGWSKYSILVKQGTHTYPREILDWPAFKSLVKAKIFIVGEDVESTDDKKVLEQKKLAEEVAESSLADLAKTEEPAE